MSKFKEKPRMGKTKEKPKSARLPRQAGHMMKEKYIKELDQRPKGAKSDGLQAPDQVEHAGRWAAGVLAGRAMEQGREFAKKKYAAAHEKTQTMPDTPAPEDVPSVQGAPRGQSVPHYPTTAPRESRTADTSPIAPKERPQAGYTAAPIKNRQTAEPHTASPPKERPIVRDVMQRHTVQKVKERPAMDMPRSTQFRTIRNTQPGASGRLSSPSAGYSEAVPPGARRQRLLKECPQSNIRGRGTSSLLASDSGGKSPRPSKAGPTPKVRRSVFKPAAKPVTRSAAPAARAAKVTRQQMQRQLFTQAKPAAKGARATVQRAVQAVVKAASAVTGAISGIVGGCVLLVALVIIIVIAAVANSPFGLFFAQEPSAPDAVSVSQAVGSVNTAYNARLELLQTGDYNSIDIQGTAPDWPEILAVFAVKVAGAEVGGMDVATLDPDRVAKLTAVFWDMTTMTATVETIPHPDSNLDDDVDDSWVEKKLHITIAAKTADDMRAAYAFTAYQNSALDELLADRATLSSLAGSLTITSADVLAIWEALPDDLLPERRAVVEKVLSLVGKVNYFWGGKSYVIGWDPRWGTLQKVTSPGSTTSGTYRPYGLDCSGFLDWALRNAGLHSDGHWYIGRNLVAVPLSDAIPGDFALYPDASHVGLIVGRNAAGKLLVCHCASGQNNVVVTEFSASGFTAVGRQMLVPG